MKTKDPLVKIKDPFIFTGMVTVIIVELAFLYYGSVMVQVENLFWKFPLIFGMVMSIVGAKFIFKKLFDLF